MRPDNFTIPLKTSFAHLKSKIAPSIIKKISSVPDINEYIHEYTKNTHKNLLSVLLSSYIKSYQAKNVLNKTNIVLCKGVSNQKKLNNIINYIWKEEQIPEVRVSGLVVLTCLSNIRLPQIKYKIGNNVQHLPLPLLNMWGEYIYNNNIENLASQSSEFLRHSTNLFTQLTVQVEKNTNNHSKLQVVASRSKPYKTEIINSPGTWWSGLERSRRKRPSEIDSHEILTNLKRAVQLYSINRHLPLTNILHFRIKMYGMRLAQMLETQSDIILLRYYGDILKFSSLIPYSSLGIPRAAARSALKFSKDASPSCMLAVATGLQRHASLTNHLLSRLFIPYIRNHIPDLKCKEILIALRVIDDPNNTLTTQLLHHLKNVPLQDLQSICSSILIRWDTRNQLEEYQVSELIENNKLELTHYTHMIPATEITDFVKNSDKLENSPYQDSGLIINDYLNNEKNENQSREKNIKSQLKLNSEENYNQQISIINSSKQPVIHINQIMPKKPFKIIYPVLPEVVTKKNILSLAELVKNKLPFTMESAVTMLSMYFNLKPTRLIPCTTIVNILSAPSSNFFRFSSNTVTHLSRALSHIEDNSFEVMPLIKPYHRSLCSSIKLQKELSSLQSRKISIPHLQGLITMFDSGYMKTIHGIHCTVSGINQGKLNTPLLIQLLTSEISLILPLSTYNSILLHISRNLLSDIQALEQISYQNIDLWEPLPSAEPMQEENYKQTLVKPPNLKWGSLTSSYYYSRERDIQSNNYNSVMNNTSNKYNLVLKPQYSSVVSTLSIIEAMSAHVKNMSSLGGTILMRLIKSNNFAIRLAHSIHAVYENSDYMTAVRLAIASHILNLSFNKGNQYIASKIQQYKIHKQSLFAEKVDSDYIFKSKDFFTNITDTEIEMSIELLLKIPELRYLTIGSPTEETYSKEVVNNIHQNSDLVVDNIHQNSDLVDYNIFNINSNFCYSKILELNLDSLKLYTEPLIILYDSNNFNNFGITKIKNAHSRNLKNIIETKLKFQMNKFLKDEVINKMINIYKDIDKAHNEQYYNFSFQKRDSLDILTMEMIINQASRAVETLDYTLFRRSVIQIFLIIGGKGSFSINSRVLITPKYQSILLGNRNLNMIWEVIKNKSIKEIENLTWNELLRNF